MKYLVIGTLLGILAIVNSDVFQSENVDLLEDSVSGLSILIEQMERSK
ncbi:hypothetical protein F485_gp198 [Aeromonas phage CC2]|uniref:Uncharacterized protein n=1 Tax=Aeromonas phage CC2 TaxID=1204516 RepID=I6XGM3_9CAUD|nr:hypothetical protein F485_gp198 [Aeromonas phage CC2]AFN39216.1 hypothetical protein CC2_097 [Aeromonas phage CC2]